MNKRLVGAVRSAERILGSFIPTIDDSYLIAIRYSGFVVLILVIYFKINSEGGVSQSLITWAATYFIYLVILEITRKYWIEHYDHSVFRLFRILANIGLFTWLAYTSPTRRFEFSLFLLIPLGSAISYFKGNYLVYGLVSIAIAGGITLNSLMISNPSPLNWIQILSSSLLFVAAGYFLHIATPRPNLILQIVEDLQKKVDLDELLRFVIRKCVELSGATSGFIVLVNRDTEEYITHVLHGFELADGKSIHELANSVLPYTAQYRNKKLEAKRNTKISSALGKFFNKEPHSHLTVQINSRRGNFLALLNVSQNEGKRITPQEKVALDELSKNIAPSIENALHYRELQLHFLSNRKDVEEFAKAESKEEIEDLLVRGSLNLIPSASSAVLHELDTVSRELIPTNSYPQSVKELGKSIMKIGEGVAGQALEKQEPLLVQSVPENPWFNKSAQVNRFESLLVAPIIHPDTHEKFGTISVNGSAVDTFNREDEIKLMSIANQAAWNFSKFRKFQKFKNQGGQMKRIFDAIKKIKIDKDVSKLGEQITITAVNLFDFQIARLRILDPHSDVYNTVSTTNTLCDNTQNKHGLPIPREKLTSLLDEKYRIENSFIIPGRDDESLMRVIEEFFTVGNPLHEKAPAESQIKEWDKYDGFLTPINSQSGKQIAILSLDEPIDGKFPTIETIEQVGVFANALGWVIENHFHTREQNVQFARIQSFINAIGDDLAKHKDVTSLGELIVQVGSNLISTEGCSLYVRGGEFIQLSNSNYLDKTEYIGMRKVISDSPGCGLISYVAATGETVLSNNREFENLPAWEGKKKHLKYLNAERECSSLLIVPIYSGGRNDEVIGVLSLENKKSGENVIGFNNRDLQLVNFLAKQFSFAFSLIHMYKSVEDWERQQGLEDDLHQLVNFFHSGVINWLEAIKYWIEQEDFEKINELYPTALENAHSAVTELKSIHSLIATKALEELDFTKAIDSIIDIWQKRVRLGRDIPLYMDCPPGIKLPIHIRSAFLRIASNAIANAINHSSLLIDPAIHIRIKLRQRGNTFYLWVKDNGIGYNEIREGFGISRIRQLARELEVTFRIQTHCNIKSVPNVGTKVFVCAELPESEIPEFLSSFPDVPIINNSK